MRPWCKRNEHDVGGLCLNGPERVHKEGLEVMAVPVPESASSEAQKARVKRGVAMVQLYLKTQFPEHIIEVLKESSDDTARSARTFSVRNNGQRYVLRVANEVLDPAPGAPSVGDRLQRFQVAQRLREEGVDKVVIVTMNDLRIRKL